MGLLTSDWRKGRDKASQEREVEEEQMFGALGFSTHVYSVALHDSRKHRPELYSMPPTTELLLAVRRSLQCQDSSDPSSSP